MDEDTLALVGNIILIAAAIPATLFLVFYLRVQWERTSIGRQTMMLSAVTAGVLDLVVVRSLVGDAPWYAALRLFVFALIIPTLWWRLYLLLTYQWRGLHSNVLHRVREESDMEPEHDALEGNLGDLGDEEYFQHLERAKAEDFHGVDAEGNRYEPDEGVQDLRGSKE